VGWDEYEIVACCCDFWGVGIEFGRKFGLEGCSESVEFYSSVDFFKFCSLFLVFSV
jgi:hypothetical protein